MHPNCSATTHSIILLPHVKSFIAVKQISTIPPLLKKTHLTLYHSVLQPPTPSSAHPSFQVSHQNEF